MADRFWQEAPGARRRLHLAVGLAGLGALLWLLFLLRLSDAVARVFLGHQTLPDVAPAVVLMALLAAGRAALVWGGDLTAHSAAAGVKRALRRRLADHLLRLGPAFVRGERTGRLVHLAAQSVESLEEYVTQYLPARTLAGAVPLVVLLAVLILDPWTVPVLLFTGPLLLVLLALIGARTREQSRRREGELAWMSAHFLDLLQGLPTLKLFGRGRDQAATVATIGRHYGDTMMDVLRTAFQTSLVLEWGTTAATALVAIEISFRLMHGLLPFDRALAVLLITPEFFQPLRQLALRYHAGSAGKAGAEALYALLDTPAPEIRGHREPPARLDVRFEDVSVAYDGGRRPALRGLSLTLAPGQTTALLGSTGAGKSTVAGLLLRFLEPDRGTITVDGVPLREIDPARWRARIAWVPQHPYLFSGTVAENLRLARPDAGPAALIAAAEEAQAHDFIARLPRGYDTPLGERGARLSGGQAQRLAIARALLKDAPLLILDEATSQLDAAREAGVAAALRRLRPQRTVLLITHRPALAATAQAVVRLEQGRAVPPFRPAGPEPEPAAARRQPVRAAAGGEP